MGKVEVHITSFQGWWVMSNIINNQILEDIRNMRQFYLTFSIWDSVSPRLTWTHSKEDDEFLRSNFSTFKESLKNRKYATKVFDVFATTCGKKEIIKSPQVVAELFLIPWRHNRVIISKCKTIEELERELKNRRAFILDRTENE